MNIFILILLISVRINELCSPRSSVNLPIIILHYITTTTYPPNVRDILDHNDEKYALKFSYKLPV